ISARHGPTREHFTVPLTTLFRSGPKSREGRSAEAKRDPRQRSGFGPVEPAQPGAAAAVERTTTTGTSLWCSTVWLTEPSSSPARSEEHTSELQSRENLVCRLLLE